MKGYPTMLVEHAVNALLARVGFDLLRNPVIKQKIQEKIQAKVNNQRVPDYIQSIKVSSAQAQDCVSKFVVAAFV